MPSLRLPQGMPASHDPGLYRATVGCQAGMARIQRNIPVLTGVPVRTRRVRPRFHPRGIAAYSGKPSSGGDRSVGTAFRAPAIVVGRRQHPVLLVAPCGSTSLTVGWCVACGRIGTSGGGARDGNPCPALAWSRSIPPPTPGGGAAGFRRRAWGGVPLDAGGRGAAAHERFGVLERGVAPARDREAGESVRPRAAGLRRDIPPVRGNGTSRPDDVPPRPASAGRARDDRVHGPVAAKCTACCVLRIGRISLRNAGFARVRVAGPDIPAGRARASDFA